MLIYGEIYSHSEIYYESIKTYPEIPHLIILVKF